MRITIDSSFNIDDEYAEEAKEAVETLLKLEEKSDVNYSEIKYIKPGTEKMQEIANEHRE